MKISIIIPIYNIGAIDLSKCLESITQQSSKNFECILVNDGSQFKEDETTCLKFSKESNWSYYKINNSGPGIARNYGLKKVTGDLIWFVDGDDILKENAVDDIIKTFKEHHQIDYFRFGAKRLSNDSVWGNIKGRHGLINLSKLDYQNTWIEPVVPWSCVVRKRLLDDNKIIFPNNHNIHQDAYYSLLIRTHAKIIYSSSKILYLYNDVRTNSITNSTKNNKSLEDYLLFLEKYIEYIVINNLFEEPIALNLSLKFASYIFDKLFDDYSGDLNKLEKRINEIIAVLKPYATNINNDALKSFKRINKRIKQD